MVRKTTKKKAPDKNKVAIIFEYLKNNPIVLAVVIAVIAFFLWKLLPIFTCMSESGHGFDSCVNIIYGMG